MATTITATAAALTASLALILTSGCSGADTKTAEPTSSRAAASTAPATMTDDRAAQMPTPQDTPTRAKAAGCNDAPSKIVGLIDESFTNGERLENTQSVTGPSGMVVVGGNIVGQDGDRVSSSDSWVMSGGEVYALSSDARRHTLLKDGRDVLGDNWTTYNDAVGECVQEATRG